MIGEHALKRIISLRMHILWAKTRSVSARKFVPLSEFQAIRQFRCWTANQYQRQHAINVLERGSRKENNVNIKKQMKYYGGTEGTSMASGVIWNQDHDTSRSGYTLPISGALLVAIWREREFQKTQTRFAKRNSNKVRQNYSNGMAGECNIIAKIYFTGLCSVIG